MSWENRLITHVVVGVIRNSQDEILIALRPHDKTFAGYWEFPGGKVELGENPSHALQRELHEELGIFIRQATPFLQTEHCYSNHDVLLDVWQISEFTGEPHGCEGQQIRWIKRQDLPHYCFLDGNRAIIERLMMVEGSQITTHNSVDFSK